MITFGYVFFGERAYRFCICSNHTG